MRVRRAIAPVRNRDAMLKFLGLCIAPFVAIWDGYVLTVLWRWFVVPTFHAPALSIPAAIGIALIVVMLTHRTRKPEDDPEYGLVLLYGIFVPAVALFWGWVVTWWM